MIKSHKVLFTSEEIVETVMEITNRIALDNKDKEVTLLTVKDGAIPFSIMVLANIHKISQDVSVESCKLSSYVNNKQTDIKIEHMPVSLSGHVIILDDISDTGNTFNFLKEYITKNFLEVTNIECCSLCVKKEKGGYSDYPHLKVNKDDYIYGFGMDTNGLFRELPFIAKLIVKESENDVSKTMDNTRQMAIDLTRA